MQIPALSVDAEGRTFFNIPALNDDQKERFPLLDQEDGRLRGFQQMNVRICLIILIPQPCPGARGLEEVARGHLTARCQPQFYKLLTHTRKAVSKLDYKTIGRKAGVIRKQFEAFGNMVEGEERFHNTLGAAQDKMISEGALSASVC